MGRIITVAAVLLSLWVGSANITFAFRHPHLTDTERLIHWRDALMFREVE